MRRICWFGTKLALPESFCLSACVSPPVCFFIVLLPLLPSSFLLLSVSLEQAWLAFRDLWRSWKLRCVCPRVSRNINQHMVSKHRRAASALANRPGSMPLMLPLLSLRRPHGHGGGLTFWHSYWFSRCFFSPPCSLVWQIRKPSCGANGKQQHQTCVVPQQASASHLRLPWAAVG